jgi:hypothetical protein
MCFHNSSTPYRGAAVQGALLFSHFFTLFFKFFFHYPLAMQHEGANRLELRAPLFYNQDPALLPFCPGDVKAGETLFCFALDGAQGRSIEPDPTAFLGPLLAGGRSAAGGCGGGEGLELPQGHYLFAQERRDRPLEEDEIILMAIEVQKDGLWERLALEDRLYLRYLHEDGSAVTQIFRPYQP